MTYDSCNIIFSVKFEWHSQGSCFHSRNEFDFWKVQGFTLTLQETRSIHDSMDIRKIEFIAYI